MGNGLGVQVTRLVELGKVAALGFGVIDFRIRLGPKEHVSGLRGGLVASTGQAALRGIKYQNRSPFLASFSIASSSRLDQSLKRSSRPQYARKVEINPGLHELRGSKKARFTCLETPLDFPKDRSAVGAAKVR